MALLEPRKKGKLARHWPLWTWALIIVFLALLASAVVSFLLFMLAGGGAAAYVGHKLSQKPGLCAPTCHVMKESVESWKESTHEGIVCAECHNRPGPRGLWEGAVIAPVKETWLMITANYGRRPMAVDVADESCMREHCHKMRLLHGKAPFKRVVFDHSQHLERIIDGKKLRCVSCHSQMVMGTHMAVTEQVCFVCHFKESPKGAVPHSCPLCHEGPIEPVAYRGMYFDHRTADRLGQRCEECHSEISHGKGESNPEKCKACHAEEHPEEKVEDAAAMHESHVVVHNAKCFDCHNEISHSIPEDFEVPCGKCHVSENAIYHGLDRSGRSIIPNRKADPLGMDCTVCHKEDADYGVREQDCEACHQGKKGRTIEDVQMEFEKELASAKEAVSRLRSAKSSPRSALMADAALANLEMLAEDPSKGVHNMRYSRLLASSVKELAAAARSSAETPARSSKPALKPGTEEKKPPHGDLGECSKCH